MPHSTGAPGASRGALVRLAFAATILAAPVGHEVDSASPDKGQAE